VRFTKAIIDEKLVAWAEWHYHFDEEKKKDEDDPWPEGANVEACKEIFGKLYRFREERMAGTRHALLTFLVTLPEFQGRGPGSALLRQGLLVATMEEMPAWLES